MFFQAYIFKNSKLTVTRKKSQLFIQVLKPFAICIQSRYFIEDISIKNVLLKQYDDVLVVKLSDFGLVKIADSDLTH